jgi:predicted pyridoxine 5'-phosphate oxidase superfamily flavin-nucleotide-binding protein
MAILPRNVQDLLRKGHTIVWVATIGEDGWPNVAAKGSGGLIDEEHVYFADVLSKKTRANLLYNSRVAVGIYDPDSKLAVQLKGVADLMQGGELFDRLMEQTAKVHDFLPPIKYVVRIHVDEVYDMSPGPNSGERLA